MSGLNNEVGGALTGREDGRQWGWGLGRPLSLTETSAWMEQGSGHMRLVLRARSGLVCVAVISTEAVSRAADRLSFARGVYGGRTGGSQQTEAEKEETSTGG